SQCTDADGKRPPALDGSDRKSGASGLARSSARTAVAIAEPDEQPADGTGAAGPARSGARPAGPDAAADEQARRTDATPAKDHERNLRARSEDAATVRRQRW